MIEDAEDNIATIAILGAVDVNFASGAEPENAYLTTGLEWADSFACNVPLTMKTMSLVEDVSYTGSLTTSGKFSSKNDSAIWNATIILTESETTQSFTPSSNADNNITYGSSQSNMVVVTDANGTRTLENAVSGTTTNVARLNSDSYYTSLTDAYTAAVDGDTITLLADCSGEGTLTVEKAIIIACDTYFDTNNITAGDGYTKSVNGTTVTVTEDPALTLTASPSSLTGGGTVTLTVTGLPDGEIAGVDVTCDDSSITVTKSSDNTWSATLPNSTEEYTFTATYDGNELYSEATDTCTVSVTRRSNSSSSDDSSDAPTTYTVSVDDTDNGDVTVSPRQAERGETVTITIDPDEGYELDELTVTDSDGDEIDVEQESSTEYTFVMPRGRVTVEATFAEITEDLAFTDVPTSAYYYDAVYWAVENGVTNGTTATTFSPDATVTRAQTVTFLWRSAGSPAVSGSSFTDVVSDAYYADAVAWAVSEGSPAAPAKLPLPPRPTVPVHRS